MQIVVSVSDLWMVVVPVMDRFLQSRKLRRNGSSQLENGLITGWRAFLGQISKSDIALQGDLALVG